MSELTEERVGFGLGLLGGLLIALGGLVSLAMGTADLVVGRAVGALTASSEGVVLLVVGGLAVFFAWLGRRAWSGRPLASGVLLVVVAVLAGAVVGVGATLLALVGSLFVVLAGILFLLEPAKRAASAVVSPT